MIRPMADQNVLGFVGRSIRGSGGIDGSAQNLSRRADAVSLGGNTYNFAKLYQPTQLYKMMGAVEIVCSPE